MIATSAAVATPHPEATLAARDILLAGGNAFDAAVAAMVTLCVVQSHQVGLGGYGGNLVAYHAKDKKVVSIDFDSRAPFAFSPELFQNTNDRNIGYKSISVPSVIAGLDLTLKTYGTQSWSEVTKRAIALAEEGFATDEPTARYLRAWTEKTDAESRKHFFPGRSDTPKENDPWIQKDLANLLRRIASEGPDVFYTGDIARQIVAHVRAQGGILTERDFAEYHATQVAPVTTTYHGHQLYVPPPPAGGITTLQILKVLEHFDLQNRERWSADYFHLLAQAIHLCWSDRVSALGDPDVVNIPIEQFLSEDYIRAKAKQITAGPVGVPPRAAQDRMNHTANVTILDRAGNLVSTTATQGMVFGSQVVIPGLGLIMNHGMSRFDYDDPTRPNAPKPGKRMHHNMAPTLILQNENPRFAFGLPGGTKIITVTAQLAINFIDYQTTPRDCIFSPRIHTEPGTPLGVSSAVPDSVIEQLEQLGHTVVRGQQVGGNKNEIAGNANALAIDPKTRIPTIASQASADSAIIL
jgi:gamma-glutamyltranspeptidase/glutathione hydrolase